MNLLWRNKRLPQTSATSWLRLFAGVVLLLVLGAPGQVSASAFPFYHRYESFSKEDPTRERWILYPFYKDRQTSHTEEVAVHPLFSWYRETDTRRKDFDILWPLYTYRYRPERNGAEDYRRAFLLPIYYNRVEKRFGHTDHDRFILPIWFQGSQGDRGRYVILFPLIWYAYNARLAVPLFPPREQTFGAVFPLIGDFRGYWNRDRITFFLWPFFVYSSAGQGEDFNEIHSFLWPIFAKYSGPKVSGFRIFPLFSYVQKDDEFKRGWLLWPLGHYRQGRISESNPEQQSVEMFLPFYASFRRPNVKFDALFPFYGRLETGQRVSKGYALAFYNQEYDYRRGVREDRVGWFIYRRRVPLKGYDPEEVSKKATTGGGVFPFYTAFSNPTKKRITYLWPIGSYRWNKYREFEFERKYFVPFYSSQTRTFNNGDYARNKFIFPFFRERKTLAGQQYKNVLHLWFYTYAPPVDRLWAPLWTFWEKEVHMETGAKVERVMKNAYIREELPDGSVKKQLNLLLLDYETTKEPGKEKRGHTRFLFGLFGTHREPQKKIEVFRIKF